jgi:hypothetical protein
MFSENVKLTVQMGREKMLAISATNDGKNEFKVTYWRLKQSFDNKASL